MYTGNYLFGDDPIDFNNDTSAQRIGSKIRKIRRERGMTQKDLGTLVDLTADRIQKYENGARKPKPELLKKIASALGVSTLALTDPVLTYEEGVMHAIFDLENTYGISVRKQSGEPNADYFIVIDSKCKLYEDVSEWYSVFSRTQEKLIATTSDDEKKGIIEEYHHWEWNYPRALTEQFSKEMRLADIKDRITELQEEYDKLKDE